MNLRELLFLHAASGGSGSLVEYTATGNPVVFNTNVAKPLNSVVVPLSCTQAGSGDPYPPGGGKNKFNKDAAIRRDGYYFDADGSENTSQVSGYLENYIPVTPNTNYIVSCNEQANNVRAVYFYTNEKVWIERTSSDYAGPSIQFYTPSNCYFIRLQYYIATSFNQWQLELGTTATSYAPYSNIRPISGVGSLFCVHAKKNIGYLRGYSATNRQYEYAGVISNSYGTTISSVEPVSSLVITQTDATMDYGKSNYRNGYFSIRTDNMVDGQRYDISMKVTDITSNPLNASVSDWMIMPGQGSGSTPSEVIGNTLIVKNLLYREAALYRQAFEIRNCGMSCTVSEFMVTPANTNDGVYEPFDGGKLDVVFPALGTNLLKITNENIQVFGSNTITPNNNYGYSWPASVNGGFIVPCKPNTQYTYKVKYEDNLSGWYYRVWYSDTTTFVNNEATRIVNTPYSSENEVTFTTPSDANYLLVGCYIYSTAAAEGGSVIEAQLTEGSSALPFEPYNNSVYGGSLDLVSGVLTVEWEEKSARWGDIRADRHQTSGYYQGTINFDHDMVPAIAPSDYGSKILCNINNLVRWEGTSYTPEHIYLPSSNKKIAKIIGDYDPDTIVQIVAKYETPITIQLDPHSTTAIKGTNTFWTNTTGDLTVVYLDKATS